MDVVYLVRPGNRNEELRWSLRCLDAHMPGRRVWIVGHKLPWLTGVEHLSTRQDDHKHLNTLANLRAACRHGDISPQFVLMNDDFFLLQDVVDQVPTLHRGTLNEFIAQYRRTEGGARLGWYQRAVQTRETLAKLGHDPDAVLSYELHVPMVVDRERWLAGVKELERIGRGDVRWWTKRSFYGNYAGVGGERSTDCKILDDAAWDRAGGAAAVSQWRSCSTADGSFKYGRVGRWLRERYQARCRFERTGP